MITIQHLLALSPVIILSATIVAVMLSIACERNNNRNANISLIGMLLALASFFVVTPGYPLMVTKLLQIDHFTLFYTGFVIVAGIITILFARSWLETLDDNRDEFYLLLLISVLGGSVLASASHFISFFVGIELLSLPLFGLIGYAYKHKMSLEAAIKYMILSAVTSSCLLFGIALIFSGTGDLYFDTLGAKMSIEFSEPLLMLGFGMIVVGIGFKLSLAPFQLWTPDVYQGAPTSVTFYLATGAKIAVFAVVMRLFTVMPVIDSSSIHLILVICAFISIFFGNFVAMLQSSIKRLLAYSSIAHMGYLLIVLIALDSQAKATEALNVYLISYLLSSIAVFGTVCLVSGANNQVGEGLADGLKGLFWRSPALAISMTLSLLSLAGVPLTIGFIGKFYIFVLAVGSQLWWLLAFVIIGTALGLYYYLRVAINLFLRVDAQEVVDINPHASLSVNISKVCIIVSAILVFILGIYPRYIIDLAIWAQIG